jgi:hypothetical protein
MTLRNLSKSPKGTKLSVANFISQDLFLLKYEHVGKCFFKYSEMSTYSATLPANLSE